MAGEKQNLLGKGLGDTIEKIVKAMGFPPCEGCKKRKKKLNKLFRYGK